MGQAEQSSFLNPSICFSEGALRDFLRLSRTAIDDTIGQKLNALLPPTASQQQTSSTRRRVPATSCEVFRQKVLFPAWHMRSNLLEYCAGVATSPDPDDPEHLVREVEDAKARDRIVNERLDPYSARYFPKEARTERLAAMLRNERTIEQIVRDRTWTVVADRCHFDAGRQLSGGPPTWQKALDDWRARS